MDWIEAFEIFSLVTGVIYLVLEVLQKNFMWVVGILTAAAAVVAFAAQHLYASMSLNVYYVVVSVIGLAQWKRDEEKVQEGIHLRKISGRGLLLSACVFAAGTVLLYFILSALGDPASWLDAGVTVLSAVATWWLAKSIPQQWILWIVADFASAYLCFSQGMNWMTVLYVFYALSAIYGYYHWKKQGSYV